MTDSYTDFYVSLKSIVSARLEMGHFTPVLSFWCFKDSSFEKKKTLIVCNPFNMSHTFFLQYTSQQQTSSAVCCIAQ